jgi:phosphatidate phosphatase APP1
VGKALVPTHRPEFIVISDVDDTVLQSNVTSLLMALRTMLFENARTRLPFPGVAAFYQALRAGPTGRARNPTFYVSSSPWNLYDIIEEFLAVQRIPAGPLLLRDVDIGLGVLSSRHHHTHKREMIRRVLTTCAEPAILIGDSGQEDPEIYREVVRDYPGRIRAIYIRNVSMNADRSRAIQALADEVLAAGSSLVLADDTLTAARHAAEHGFIARESLDSIAVEKRADEGVTSAKKDVPGARDATEPPTPTTVVE